LRNMATAGEEAFERDRKPARLSFAFITPRLRSFPSAAIEVLDGPAAGSCLDEPISEVIGMPRCWAVADR
jgi:hypothetical protein